MTKKTKKEVKMIRVYPRKDFIGWTIPLSGFGRFQPVDETCYVEVPISAKEVLSKRNDIFLEEVENG